MMLMRCAVCVLVMPLYAAAQPEPKRSPTPADGARQMVAAVLRAAQANARLPAPLTGDALTVRYIRDAALASRRLPEDVAPRAFLLALGIALDDSEILRKNPLTANLCRQIESDDERKVRLAVLGEPTMRGRRDWTQHFVVSCLLTEVVGEQLAEAAGLLKEQMDAQPGGSGFSFGDLCADYAGVAFAVRLKKGVVKLDALDGFVVTDFLPKASDLPEDLSQAAFVRDYGSVSDPRFRAMQTKLRQRIDALPGYNKPRKSGTIRSHP